MVHKEKKKKSKTKTNKQGNNDQDSRLFVDYFLIDII